jgi:hypothetical protein
MFLFLLKLLLRILTSPWAETFLTTQKKSDALQERFWDPNFDLLPKITDLSTFLRCFAKAADLSTF